MKKIINILFALFYINNIYGHEANREIILSSTSEDKFVDVIECLFDTSQKSPFSEADSTSQTLCLEVAVNSNQIFVKSSKQQSVQRNYLIPVTQSEKDDLVFITTTLARSSLPSLAVQKPALKRAGDRIDHLHPLRFLMTVFTDEELKANISGIRGRGGWVWDKFYDGLEGSLKEEARKNNMRDEFVVDFANTIGINASIIQPSIQGKRWKELVNTLIDSVPRSGNTARYDM